MRKRPCTSDQTACEDSWLWTSNRSGLIALIPGKGMSRGSDVPPLSAKMPLRREHDAERWVPTAFRARRAYRRQNGAGAKDLSAIALLVRYTFVNESVTRPGRYTFG